MKTSDLLSEQSVKFPSISMIMLERCFEKVEIEGPSNLRYNQVLSLITELENMTDLPSNWEIAKNKALDIAKNNLNIFLNNFKKKRVDRCRNY